MKKIVTIIKIIFISILSIFYYPVNTAFMSFQSHYRAWKREDYVSYIIATPLYLVFFLISTIISIPFERVAETMHPPLKGFR